jgi:hypothetical protein
MNNIKLHFPISKAQLQSGFILKKNIVETEKKNILNTYINNELDIISCKIINSTIDETHYNNLKNNMVMKYIPRINTEKKCIETICKSSDKENNCFKTHIGKIQKLIYKFEISIDKLNERLNNNIKIINYTSNSINETDLNDAKLKILEGLILRFPDSVITMDDQQTCLTIDWN